MEEWKQPTLKSLGLEKIEARTASGNELVQQLTGVVAALKIQVSGRESLVYIGSCSFSDSSGVWYTLTISPNGANESSSKELWSYVTQTAHYLPNISHSSSPTLCSLLCSDG